jgi:hypothetical protein
VSPEGNIDDNAVGVQPRIVPKQNACGALIGVRCGGRRAALAKNPSSLCVISGDTRTFVDIKRFKQPLNTFRHCHLVDLVWDIV